MPQVVEAIALRRPLDQIPDDPAQLSRDQKAGQTGARSIHSTMQAPASAARGRTLLRFMGNSPFLLELS